MPKFIKGQGHGKEYRPWLTVRDVPSEGLSSRVKGWITGRVHHFLSQLETYYFYILDWSKKIIDIREQYPLPISETAEIAKRLNINHPRDPRTKELIVMTTDFLIDIEVNGEKKIIARTVKPSQLLDNKRVIEKFEIERTYWTEKGIDWGIVTEKEISKILAENIRDMHSFKDIKGIPGITPKIVVEIEPIFYKRLSTSTIPLAHVALEMDSKFGLKEGSCLSLFRYFLANRIWTINLEESIDTAKPVNISHT
jgi:hypothetical protein